MIIDGLVRTVRECEHKGRIKTGSRQWETEGDIQGYYTARIANEMVTHFIVKHIDGSVGHYERSEFIEINMRASLVIGEEDARWIVENAWRASREDRAFNRQLVTVLFVRFPHLVDTPYAMVNND